MAEAARQRWGRIDILHYNVGLSLAGGDARLEDFTEDSLRPRLTINLRGAIMATKHVLPVMRAQRAGVILDDLVDLGATRTTLTWPTRRPRPA